MPLNSTFKNGKFYDWHTYMYMKYIYTTTIKKTKQKTAFHDHTRLKYKMERMGGYHVNQAVLLGHWQPDLMCLLTWCDLHNILVGKFDLNLIMKKVTNLEYEMFCRITGLDSSQDLSSLRKESVNMTVLDQRY